MQRPRSPVVTRQWTSPIGSLVLTAHDRALCGAWFENQKGVPDWALTASRVQHHPVLDRAVEQLQAYLAGHRQQFDLPLDTSFGTPFQQAVWRALQHIGYGQTVSYGDIARAIGQPQAVRAVGGAVGRNPIGIIVPCHRVVGRDGALTGYTGGLERKIALLKLEAV